MKIKELSLCMDRGDKITFEGKWIGDFNIKNITTNIERVSANCVDKVDEASTVAIEIASGANGIQDPFFPTLTIFERIMEFKDIIQIRFTLTDEYEEEKYQIYVPWKDNENPENENQTTYLSKFGNLYIVVSKDKTFDDFFDKTIINDQRYMDQIYRAYHIGEDLDEDD